MMLKLIRKTLHRSVILPVSRRQSTKREPKVSLPKELSAEKYHKLRLQNVMRLKSESRSWQESPYPHYYPISMTVKDFVEKYADLKLGEDLPGESIRIAGRIHAVREMSKKLIFYDLKNDGSKVQVMAWENFYAAASADRFHEDIANIRRGDIIGISGFPRRTKTGELSIVSHEIRLLAPCLHMLPADRFGLKNQQSRYRQRYLDLLLNDRTRNIFLVRAKIVKFIRDFFEKMDFLEVETPTMSEVASGAVAKPFRTRFDELKLDLVMRIAPELFLKMLIVGGYNRVFEIGRLYRNEGTDLTHNPEFTTCEGYMAYADYNDMMEIIEKLLSQMVLKLFGSYVVRYHPDGPETEKVLELNFEPPFRRIDMITELEEALAVKLPAATELGNAESLRLLTELCQKHNLDCSEPKTVPKLIDKLVGEFLEKKCNNPTFIINHPQIMSPLAKYHREQAGLAERFELFVAKHELCNAYTELNDPVVQRDLFAEQALSKAQGDDEAQLIDENFCTALEYGLPPTCGFGIGIERLTMLLTDSNNIKEVLLFPLLRPSNRYRNLNST